MLFFLVLYTLLNAQEFDCEGEDLDQLPCKCASGSEPDGCTCSESSHPPDCECPTDSEQLTGIPAATCACLSENDPRVGEECPPQFCMAKDTPVGCVCSLEAVGQYTLEQCEADKIICPPIIADNETKDQECTEITQKCNELIKAQLDLLDTNDICPCYAAGDTRDGCINLGCNNPNVDLTNVPIALCPCQPQNDVRSICQQCPRIVKNNATISQQCVGITKKCSDAQLQDLVDIPVENCSCLPAGDPRAGILCPSYCTSKNTPTNCVCQSGTKGSYSKDKCEADQTPSSEIDIDCPTKPQIDTPKTECSCPIIRYSDEWNEDPRTIEGGICADAQLIKTIQAVIFIVISIPILALI